MLGAIAAKKGLALADVEFALKEKFSGAKEKYIPNNVEAIKIGMECCNS